MHLRRMRIYGFKSFGQDVTIDLMPGITALVGPNGGGKSNVVDAIRWALGEQRLRDLRAERWEDLLHQGGASRAAARLAEVTLEFDNHDGEMAQWPESLTVARRYYRSGDSEYLINGQTARLKDITDLFLDSGLGRFSYAIISQGRVEGALLQKPLERLEQLEEAAGVSRYKVRKRETLTHLAETEAKLIRLQDLMDEVERQMSEVRDRAETESRYRTWELLRRDWQSRLDFTEYQRAVQKRQRLEEQLATLAEERQKLAQELTRVVEEAAEARRTVEAWGTELEAEARELTELKAQETQIRMRETELNARLDHIKRERESLAAAAELLSEHEAQLAGERPETASVEEDLADLRRVYEEEARIAALSQEAQRNLEKEAEQLRHRMGLLNARRAQIEQQLARLQGLLRIGADTEAMLDAIRARREETARLEHDVRELTAQVAHLTDERSRMKAYQGKLEQEIYSMRHQLSGRQARLRALHQLEAEGEGLNAGVRAVLKGQQQGHLEGVIGTLGSLIESEGELLLAIQTAMGGSRQDVVMASEERAREAVRYLKTGSLGRATFLPLDTVRSARPNPDDYRRLTRESGVVGWASELVRSVETVKPAVQHVLGRVLIVQGLDDASRLGPVHHYRYKMVTLDGQIVHAGGAITGGSRQVERNSHTSRKVELEELTRRIEEDGRVVQGKEELLASVKSELDDVEQQLDEARELLGDTRHRWRQMHETLSGQDMGDPAALMQEMERIDGETAQNSQRLEQIRIEMDEGSAGLERQLAEVERLGTEVRSREQMVRERLLIAQRIEREAARLTEQRAGQAERGRALDGDEERVKAELQTLAQNLKAAAEASLRREAARAERVQQSGRMRERALALENRQRALELDDRKLEQRGHAWQQEAAEITVRYEQYRVPEGVSVLTRSEEENARREVGRITQSLSELGAVVPGSLALFEQLQERQSFLKRESDDVDEARTELEATLKEIDAEMERRVKETASRVEHAFGEACRQLYGGGEGGFSWVDGADGGVELWVRPPGKRPSHLGLLSGGEKALGGIAWLFSLLSVRPSPFVVLDEVEASLDEANAARFAEFIRAARGSAQYVIVTHHRQTMEAADALWGVAGDGQGQSRLISVLLGETEQMTS